MEFIELQQAIWCDGIWWKAFGEGVAFGGLIVGLLMSLWVAGARARG